MPVLLTDLWSFDPALTMADPGPGRFRFDSATFFDLYADVAMLDAPTFYLRMGEVDPGGGAGGSDALFGDTSLTGLTTDPIGNSYVLINGDGSPNAITYRVLNPLIPDDLRGFEVGANVTLRPTQRGALSVPIPLPAGAVTVECFVTYPGIAGALLCAGTCLGTNTHAVQVFDTGVTMSLRYCDDFGVLNRIRPVMTLTVGQTYHLAFVVESNGARIYVNGVSVPLAAQIAPGTIFGTSTIDRMFNTEWADDPPGHVPWSGFVDEFAIYPRALTDAQIAAHWAAALVGDAGIGRVHWGVFSKTDARGADAAAQIAAIFLSGATIDSQVFNPSSVAVAAGHAQFVVAGTIDHPTYVEVSFGISSLTSAPLGPFYFVPDQRIVFGIDADPGIIAVGDVVVNTCEYQLVPANTTALVVAKDPGSETTLRQILLLFRDGTQGWFTDPDFTTYGIAKIDVAPDPFPAYVYTTDLQVHEDWRGGYFDPVWLPHPPAGAFAVAAQARGATGVTAPFASTGGTP